MAALPLIDTILNTIDAEDEKGQSVYFPSDYRPSVSTGIFGTYTIAPRPREPRITLGYWAIQGLGSAARMMMVYAGVDFKNVMYTQKGPEENYSRAEWYDVKYTLGFDFPNLPYLIDSQNGKKMTESKAIYRYLARQFGIGVQSDPELSTADMMLEVVQGAMSKFTRLCYGNFNEETKTEYIKALPEVMKGIEAYMDGKTFLTGDEISYADFSLYYLCVAHLKLDAAFLKQFPNLCSFYETFCALDGMKRWNRTEYAHLPLNNVVAKFR